MILPGITPITDARAAPRPAMRKSSADTGSAFTLSQADAASLGRALEKSASSTSRPPAMTSETAQAVEVVEEHDVGAPAGRDEAAVAQGRRPARAVSEAAR